MPTRPLVSTMMVSVLMGSRPTRMTAHRVAGYSLARPALPYECARSGRRIMKQILDDSVRRHHAARMRQRAGGRRAAGARARRLHVCRRQDHAGRRPRIRLRPDVCRDPHPGQADASLSDHHGARRLDVRHELHRHAGRPRRLGAIFRAPGLRRLCRRPAGPRTLRIPRRRHRADAELRARQFGVALRLAGEIQALAAGRAAHAVARQRRARRSGDACSSP